MAMTANLSFSLHLEPVCRMDRLSIESCLAAGYEHISYTYNDPLKMGQLPLPAVYRDAREILPPPATTADTAVEHRNFRLRFMSAALFKHGGLWVDNDYVLTQRCPETPFLGLMDPDREGLAPYLLRLPEGSALAKIAIHTADHDLTAEAKPILQPVAKLMDVIRDMWPARGSTRILSAAEGCPFGHKHARIIIHAAPELELERVFGYKLWRRAWEHGDTTPATKFHNMAPFEQLWNCYFGMRE